MRTLAETKQAVDALPAEQQQELDAYLRAQLRRLPVIHSDTVDDRMREMDAGEKIPWSSLREDALLREQCEQWPE